MQDWPFDNIKEFMEREFPIRKDIELSQLKKIVREDKVAIMYILIGDDSNEGIEINIQNPNEEDVEDNEKSITNFWNWFQNHLGINNYRSSKDFNNNSDRDIDENIEINKYENK
jgi:hypothetical protein